MRIAQIAPLYESVPPETYGGTERVIAALCDGLVAAGHDVTLFAAGSSSTAAGLEAFTPSPLRRKMSREELIEVAPHLHLRMLADVVAKADEFDVIHSHLDILSMPFAELSATPWVLTMHGRLDVDPPRRVLRSYPDVPLVSISNDQRVAVKHLPLTWIETVYNGLDLTSYEKEPKADGGYLAFVGRISTEKGPEAAIEIARRTGHRLRLAAKVDPMDVEYFENCVSPLLEGDIEFVGEIDESLKPGFYAGARATLFPSDWPEPFGLVMIESLAAGTPVIALRRGSVPEVIIDGVTGFICDDVDGMVDAVHRLDEIDPDECRRRARRFSAERMCTDYVDVYDTLVDQGAFSGSMLKFEAS